MLGLALKSVYEGRMTPKTGTALSNMAMAFVKAYEVSVLQADVAALEELNGEHARADRKCSAESSIANNSSRSIGSCPPKAG